MDIDQHMGYVGDLTFVLRFYLICFYELGKIDKIRGLPSILFRNKFNKFNKTRARMFDSIYHYDIKITFLISALKTLHLSLCTQHCYGRHNVSQKSVNHYRDHIFHLLIFAESRGCSNIVRGTRQV